MPINMPQLTAKLVRPDERITITLSKKAQEVLGIDDAVLVREAYPSLENLETKHGNAFLITRADARTVCFDLNERSEAGEFGFGHSAYERRVALNHARALHAQLYK